MVRPICPNRSRLGNMWVLLTLLGQKIGKANGILNLPIVPTQVTLIGKVGSLGASIAAQLFTFSHSGQANALRGS